MGEVKAKGLMKFKDKDGNIFVLYPVTKRDMVEGLGTLENNISAAAAAAAAAQATANSAAAAAAAALAKFGTIDGIEVVDALPEAPTENVLYLVKG